MPDWSVIFPELETISDAKLREQVAAVWEEAFSTGGWNIDEFESLPFTLLVQDSETTLVEHTRIVTRLCSCIAETLQDGENRSLNTDYLMAGALLHDVGKLLEFQKAEKGYRLSRSGRMLRHPLSGMGLAMKHGLPEEVCHIIAVHSREGEGSYRSPEATILHHSDFIVFEIVKSLGS